MNNQAFLSDLSRLVRKQGTQRACAKLLGVSEAYLSDVLNGRRHPGPKILEAMEYEVRAVKRGAR